MTNIEFKITDDNSVGIYDIEAGDIMHSKTGALKEAEEKFINPVLFKIQNSNNLNVLDLCSGVGYNLKALLNKTVNSNKKIYIDSVEINPDYIFLSPFLIDGISNIEIKLLILTKILNSGFTIYDLIDFLDSSIKKYSPDFFDENIIDFITFIQNEGYINNPLLSDYSFVHNIYYNYISNNNKRAFNATICNDIVINYKIEDARSYLKNTNVSYDIVFYDGYSPQKDPTLWTYDFIKLLKSKLNKNSVIVSYSKSTPFRSALLELNFIVGKIIVNENEIGTIASDNPEFINDSLSDYDLSLVNTTGGIVYRDINFNLNKHDILLNRSLEQKKSSRQSQTNFLNSIR